MSTRACTSPGGVTQDSGPDWGWAAFAVSKLIVGISLTSMPNAAHSCMWLAGSDAACRRAFCQADFTAAAEASSDWLSWLLLPASLEWVLLLLQLLLVVLLLLNPSVCALQSCRCSAGQAYAAEASTSVMQGMTERDSRTCCRSGVGCPWTSSLTRLCRWAAPNASMHSNACTSA